MPEDITPSLKDLGLTEDHEEETEAAVEKAESPDDWIPVEEGKDLENKDDLEVFWDFVKELKKYENEPQSVPESAILELKESVAKVARHAGGLDEAQFESLLYRFRVAFAIVPGNKDVKQAVMRSVLDNINPVSFRVARLSHYDSNYFSMLRNFHTFNYSGEDDFDEVTNEQIIESFNIFRIFYEQEKLRYYNGGLPSSPSFLSAKPGQVQDLCFYMNYYDSTISQDYKNIVLNSFVRFDQMAIRDLECYINLELLGSLIASNNEFTNNIVSDLLQDYKLDFNKLKEAWSTTVMQRDRASHIGQNLKTIIDLEEYKPGICATLNKQSGIEFFARYPERLLIDQFEILEATQKPAEQRTEAEKEVLARPYGIIMFPQADWNGAFYEKGGIFSSLHSDLLEKMGYSLVATEASGRFSAARRLIELDRLFGAQNKISFAFVGGHGTRETVTFGKPRPVDVNQALKTGDYASLQRHQIDMRDFALGKWTERGKTFFIENPTIILVSCSTGQDIGIGEMISSEMGARVIAPKVPTSLKSVEVKKDESGRLNFDVEYTDPNSKNEYQFGQNVDKEKSGD